ncbi:MAG: DinB family protein [Acidobacteriota bacterium]
MNLPELRTLLDYHYWARDRILDAVEPLPPEQWTRNLASSFGSVRDTLAHTYGAEWAWCERWQGGSPAALPSADLVPDVASLRAKWTALESDVRAVVDRGGEPGVDRVVIYTMLNGDTRQSVFWHMLQHVVNHASYHRGQVTTMLRQLGAAPPQGMDLITFYRTMRPS